MKQPYIIYWLKVLLGYEGIRLNNYQTFEEQIQNYPVVRITKELHDDYPEIRIEIHRWYELAWEDFNTDTYIYVWFPLNYIVGLVYWWLNSRYRFAIERLLSGRIIDKPIGHSWSWWTWQIRPIKNWTWHRVRL